MEFMLGILRRKKGKKESLVKENKVDDSPPMLGEAAGYTEKDVNAYREAKLWLSRGTSIATNNIDLVEDVKYWAVKDLKASLIEAKLTNQSSVQDVYDIIQIKKELDKKEVIQKPSLMIILSIDTDVNPKSPSIDAFAKVFRSFIQHEHGVVSVVFCKDLNLVGGFEFARNLVRMDVRRS